MLGGTGQQKSGKGSKIKNGPFWKKKNSKKVIAVSVCDDVNSVLTQQLGVHFYVSHTKSIIIFKTSLIAWNNMPKQFMLNWYLSVGKSSLLQNVLGMS